MARRSFRIAALVGAVTLASSVLAACFPFPDGAHVGCTSARSGSLGAYRFASKIVNSNGFNTYVNNNMWGANNESTQRVCASDPAHWTIDAKMAPAGGTAVQTYPSIQQLMNNWRADLNTWGSCGPCSDTPLSKLRSLSSSYTTHNPPVTRGDWQATYDIWLNNTPHNEIMIWVYTSNQRRNENGAQIIDPHVNIGGKDFTYQNYGGGLPQLVLNTNLASGTIDVLGALRYLQSIGQVSQNATMGILEFGYEMCNNVGQNQHFAVSNYSISGSS